MHESKKKSQAYIHFIPEIGHVMRIPWITQEKDVILDLYIVHTLISMCTRIYIANMSFRNASYLRFESHFWFKKILEVLYS